MVKHYGGIFDYAGKKSRLDSLNEELSDPNMWQQTERFQSLGKERAELTSVVVSLENLSQAIDDAYELLSLAISEGDESTIEAVSLELTQLEKTVGDYEFQQMFSNPMDSHHAYLEVQSGSGGTEAQDWAEMLLRMYLRWCEKRGFASEIISISPGEVAGIKSATVKVDGAYAYGWLRTETGVHRLVRKSPFDSGNRRHTSFAAIFVTPEVDDSIEIDINPGDLRIDTYRAGGAGGQHVNRTDSAVRITHIPTNIVVQCQRERSQHQNKAQAFKQLRAKLYELALQAQLKERQVVEESKADIGWGSQIRSYVLDQSRIKDLRTGVETGNTQAVLDGDLDLFVKASLTLLSSQS